MTETTTDIWSDTSEVMQRLTGSWSFDRVIEGHGTMQGTVTFSPLDRERLAYYEQGNLKLLNGVELQAEREYIFGKSDGGFEVFFKEDPPRLFHEISLTAREGDSAAMRAIYVISTTISRPIPFCPTENL